MLIGVRNGDRAALDRLFALVYEDLHARAHRELGQSYGAKTLSTTALVHESFLRLVDASELVLTDRKHFFTYAAKTMRNIIIDFAREQLAERRGGGRSALLLDTLLADESTTAGGGDAALMRINDALLELEAVDPALAQVVEMRYFAGYSEIEIAELLGSSERTVRRQWEKARAFLLLALQE